MTKLEELMEKSPDHILRKFARKCALRHVEKIKPYCSDEGYEVIVTWLETGDEELRQAAWSAVESAAWSAAWSAVESAAWSAVESVAESAAWSSARSRSAAVESVAESVARSSARSAELEWQEQTLLQMIKDKKGWE